LVSETFLFWAVIALLLCIDNLVLLPVGADYLRFNRNGRWRYEPGIRLQAQRRDLIFLNPLNPFDRLAQTDSAVGNLTPQMLWVARQRVRGTLRHANLLSLFGSCYLLGIAGLAGSSIWFYFGDVLLTLLVVHLVTWVAAVAVLVSHHETLCPSRFRSFSLALEALLVPGYLINLGKRVWYLQTLNLPALTLGLRQLKRMPIDSTRELYMMQISRRVDDLAVDLNMDSDLDCFTDKNHTIWPAAGEFDTDIDHFAKATMSFDEAQREELRNWFKEVRQCLETSVQAAGS